MTFMSLTIPQQELRKKLFEFHRLFFLLSNYSINILFKYNFLHKVIISRFTEKSIEFLVILWFILRQGFLNVFRLRQPKYVRSSSCRVSVTYVDRITR